MSKCNKCGLDIYDQEASEFVAADESFDAGEFSSSFEREWCECEEENYYDPIYFGYVDPHMEEMEYELGARWGDSRRCSIHGTRISSGDGMHDGVCGQCEAKMDYE